MKPLLPINHPSQVNKQHQQRIIVATGHRPQRLEQGYDALAWNLVIRVATEWLRQLARRGVTSVMPLGWDSAVIEACLALKIPYVGCVPFEGQEEKWPGHEQYRYKQYTELAAKII